MIERSVFLVGALVVVVLAGGCRSKTEIKVYRISKAPLEELVTGQQSGMPTNEATPALSGGMAPAASAVSKSVPTPPSWQPQPLSQMREASYLVKGDNGATVDISLIRLGPAAGHELENVNRWLAQLGQVPINREKLAAMTQTLSTPLGRVMIFDLTGLSQGADATKDGRIIVAMAPTGDSTLFFKMRGNSALTEAQKSDFIKWVAAVCDAQAKSKSPQMAGMPEMPPQSAGGAPQIKWKAPADWKQVPPSAMRYASFDVPGENGSKLDISVVTFPGTGGGDAENVNRWRGQIGLAPLDDKDAAASIVPVKAGSADFLTVDLAGTDSRVITAWTRRDGRTWFFKMSGPSSMVENEKTRFLDFLRSIQFTS
jgi:hypothetical protein